MSEIPPTSAPPSESTPDSNPFRAPSARVADRQVDAAGPLLADPRRVRAGAATEWIATGWRMFREAPGPWIGMIVVYMLILFGIGLVPLLGLFGNVLSPILGAGLMLACEGQANGERPQVVTLFEGFKRNMGSLAMIGVLILVAVMIVVLVFGVGAFTMVAGVAAAGGESSITPVAIALAVLLGFAFMVLVFPLSFAVMWAPALVAIHDLAPFPALKMGFTAGVRNWLALVVFGLLGIPLMIVVAVTLGLAGLVVGPMVFIAVWAAYRDIFRQ